MRKYLLFIACFFLSSCALNVFDPMSFAPSTPYAQWKPLQKNTLISSKYCQILLPPEYESAELTLGELIDIALHNSPQTKSTWQEAKAKAANYAQKLSEYYPELAFSGTYTRERESFTFGDTSIPYFLTTANPELNVSYTILDFGQRRSSSESARQALFFADYSHNQQIQSTLVTVMNDYYDYSYQKELLKAFEENLETASVTFDAAKEKFRSGVAALGDVSQAKSKYLQAKIDTITQVKTVKSSFATLLDDIGLPATLSCKIKDLPEMLYVNAIDESIDHLVEKAKKQRADFLAAQANVKEKEADYYHAKAISRPLLDGKFDIGKRWYNTVAEEDYHFVLTFSVSMPLFRGLYYKNGVRSAKALLEKSTSEMMEKELNIIKDVTVGYAYVESAKQNYQYSKEYLDASLLEYDIALENYKAGTNTILDVLNAQSSLADARSKFVLAKKDWYQSIAQLAYATGSLCAPSACEEI